MTRNDLITSLISRGAILLAVLLAVCPIAAQAAVLGRSFTYPVLAAALVLDEAGLVDDLDELWRRRIIREVGGDGYDFSHDRIRDVAYEVISQARRRLLHRRAGEALLRVHHAQLPRRPGRRPDLDPCPLGQRRPRARNHRRSRAPSDSRRRCDSRSRPRRPRLGRRPRRGLSRCLRRRRRQPGS